MSQYLRFNATPSLPPALEPLREIAFNLWWAWHAKARWLFWFLDPKLWEKVNHSPLKMLQQVSQARLEAVAKDEDFLEALKSVTTSLRSYLAEPSTWAAQRPTPFTKESPICYLSAEFGFHESIPIYSGGLGILSGDHTKAASDLGLNFIGISLLYRHGYFKQQISREGRQEAVQLNQNFRQLPISETVRDGTPVVFSLKLPDGPLSVKVWEMKIGRVTLYLLDTDLPENRPEDRVITAQLYGGDKEMRIKQEIVLGIGGERAVTALGLKPAVFHMNEGHSAFLALERIRVQVEKHGLDFNTALQVVAASTVFTTHTPVPAGNEVFHVDMMRKYFEGYAHDLGIGFDRLMSLGQPTVGANPAEFSMTILALRTSRHANGVSKIHGKVSRRMWKDVWHGVPEEEVPITSITNGIHTRTWLAPEIAELYDKYLGSDWDNHLDDADFWRRVIEIPDGELWETHQKLKSRLIDFVRVRLRRQRERNAETPERMREVNRLLEPEILTIGFARRFATYKRALLLFSKPERLKALLNNPERPVQFLFAGKAHPADGLGQEFIRQVVEFAEHEDFKHRIVFIEDYDACIGRRLYQGVDLWLNNPLRPLEASGTSGMKPPPNGGLNLSVLDGWWAEAYNGKNGWAIGEEIEDGSMEFQNEVDAESLYSILENQVAPLFYARPDGRLPLAWIQLMRDSMRTVTPQFNTSRMVEEYTTLLYEPAAAAAKKLAANSFTPARTLRDWKDHMRRSWDGVRIEDAHLEVADASHVPVGQTVKIVARVRLGDILPEHVSVQACLGRGEGDAVVTSCILPLTGDGPPLEHGVYLFTGEAIAQDSGEYAISLRVIPKHDCLTQAHELRLIRWFG